ncbi:hypothetical protein GQ457_11G026940 [Hibiscus cannabinus]
MIAEFQEENNSSLNPRKHRRVDDEPLDTGDPHGPSPPVLHADSRLPSYKEKLTGHSRLPAEDEENFDEDEIEILEGDVSKSMVDGIISIAFSEWVRNLAIKSYDQTVVVKLLGRRIGYNTLRIKLYDLWKPAQAFRLMDIENDYFLVTFRSQSDYLNIFAGGPWVIFGSYLTVEPWSEDFSTAQPHPRKVIAWIRLPGLPVTLYKRSIIQEIGECIGSVVRIDYQTDSGRCGRFSRMAVTIDLHKPLVSKLIINDRIQLIEYESLPKICFSCGKYGHVHDNCPMQQTSMESTDLPEPPQPEHPKPSESEPFGPWMVVERKQRRGPRKHMDAELPPSKPAVVASRFSPISEVVTSDIAAQASVFGTSQDPHAISKGKATIFNAGKPSKPKSATVALDRVNHSAVTMSENADPNFLVSPILRGQPTCDVVSPDRRDSGGTSMHSLPAGDITAPSEQSKGVNPSDRATMLVDLRVEPNMGTVA